MTRVFLWVLLFWVLHPVWSLVPAPGATAVPVGRSEPPAISDEERFKIDRAIPSDAIVRPDKPRKLLIFDGNVGYAGHRSIHHANLAFTLMGQRTGAYETVIREDPSVFEPEKLRRFDAVFFNNTVGNLFEDPGLRRSLIDFVYRGGGLLGVHGTSVAFTKWPGAHEDWPEFGMMLGARGASHRDSDEHAFIQLDDPSHPLNRVFAQNGFEYRDEFFRVHDPYSRDRLRVLFHIDTRKTDMNQGQARGDCVRADEDYALAWVRSYGRGRVFYCTIAHNPYVFWDPRMLTFYLGAVQFCLGDLPAPTTPSSRLTPAVLARERLGWRLAATQESGDAATLFDAVDRASSLGLSYIGARNGQKISRDIPKSFNDQLSDDDLSRIRMKLGAAGVRLLSYSLDAAPDDERSARQIFSFARRMGVEIMIADAAPETLDAMDKLSSEYDVTLAIRHPRRPSSLSGVALLRGLREACEGRSERIGVCGDLAAWVNAGVDPESAVRALGDRLVALELSGEYGRDAVGESRGNQLEQYIEKICLSGVKPIMFAVSSANSGPDSTSAMARRIDWFNRLSLRISKREGQ